MWLGNLDFILLQMTSPEPAVSVKNLSYFPSILSKASASTGGSFESEIFSQIAANLALRDSHFAASGAVSGLIASAGHSGSHTAIDAFIGMDHQHVLPLIEAIDGENRNAVSIFAFDAVFGHDVRHLALRNKNDVSGRVARLITVLPPPGARQSAEAPSANSS